MKSSVLRRVLVIGAATAVACLNFAARAAEPAIPPELEPWRAWVLHGEEFRRCPFFAQSDAQGPNAFACAWPEKLTLDLDARGGRFAQRWQLHTETWITLPGNTEHWPRDVTVNGAKGAVVEHDQVPQLFLQPGSYSISGGFRWDRRPESLPVPRETGVVELILDGQSVAQPERSDGSVWLGKRRAAEERAQMEIQVYRLVEDQIPGRLTTLVRLQVAGDGREELLAPVLPEGFVPVRLTSDLPARIESDGRMRVQVRAGSWPVMIVARAPGVIEKVRRPKGEGPWAKEEVWSFSPDDRLRVVSVEGANSIDPAQAGVPVEWRQLPAYRMTPEDEIRVIERSRALSAADENRLRLARELWLDFDHDGFTARDQIAGTMRHDWRLDAHSPQRVLSAQAGEDNLLITKGSDGALTGVEIRSPNVSLTAVSRIERDGALSATGWLGRFESARGVLNLPPGHRLLAALGADATPGAWVERWRLLDMFLVLLVAVAAGRLFGWRIGAIALLALVLVYHEAPVFAWLWINVLVAYVLAREAREGLLRRLATIYRNLSFAVLLLVLVPFLFQQFRLAVYPQLEQLSWLPAADEGYAAPPAPMAMGEPKDAEEVVVTGALVATPAAEAPADMARRSDSYASKMMGGLNRQQVVQRYAPGTVVQAGPGVPTWRYNSYSYSWSGPVDSSQTVRFLVLTPWMLTLWRVIGSVLLAVLFVFLASRTFSWPPRMPAWTQRFGFSSALAALSVMTLSAMPAADARADTPDAAVLNELKARLIRAPKCTPACGEILNADVRVSGDRLEVQLAVSALAAIAIPVPAAGGRWDPETISIDSQPSGALLRDSGSVLWVPLRPGTHDVRLTGRLAPVDSVQLQFQMRPHTIQTSGEGWDFSGISEGRLLTNALELVRQRKADSRGRFDPGGPFPAFALVDRQVVFDLDWMVYTHVTRLAPEKGVLTMQLPLLPGESVLTPGIEVRKDAVLVGIPAGDTTFSWQSGLARSERLVFELPSVAPRTETWRFAVSPQWHVAFNGTPALLPQDTSAEQWQFEFHPRPGEKLEVAVSRPASADGSTLAIDNVQWVIDAGKRSTNSALELDYRSTQGGRHSITLPREARVTAVETDGTSVPLRPTEGELTFGLLPGKHHFAVRWEMNEGVSFNTRVPPAKLHSPASNLRTRLDLPADRWVLYAYGPGVGPAILLWSELAVFIVLALLIGRRPSSPLSTTEWLLLGLGLSTFSWSVLVLFAAWLFIMRWRESLSSEMGRMPFNFLQIALAVLSVIALVSLLAAVPNGLLGSPDMRVRTASGMAGVFEWFNDQTNDLLPQPGVISVSIWWYKAAMLAWALWLSFALMRWVPWAWRAWTKGGLWRSAPPPKKLGSAQT